MGESLCILTLADGRTLTYALWGDPNGFPVFTCHGTPGCRLGRYPDEDVYRSAGVRWITHDRAGYGRSTRHAGRCVADEAADIAALADALGIGRFAVTGGSGGRPHALACAALLGDRVIRAMCHVGLAPLGALSREPWFARMAPENVQEFSLAEAGEPALRPAIEREHRAMLERVVSSPSNILGPIEISASDREHLARPDVMRAMAEMVPEMCACGVGGWIDDDLAFVAPWGFEIASIRVPTLVRYGLADVLVPAAHGAWLAANIPGAIASVQETGHMGTSPLQDLRQTIAWLRDGIAP